MNSRLEMWDSQLVSSVCESTFAPNQQREIWVEGAQALDIAPENPEEELISFANFTDTLQDVFEPLLLPYFKDAHEASAPIAPTPTPQEPAAEEDEYLLPMLFPQPEQPPQPTYAAPADLKVAYSRPRSSSFAATKRSYSEATESSSSTYTYDNAKRRNSAESWATQVPPQPFTPLMFVTGGRSSTIPSSPSSQVDIFSDFTSPPSSTHCSPTISSPSSNNYGGNNTSSSWVWKNQTQRICNKYICVPLPPHVKAMTNMMGHFRLDTNSPSPQQDEVGNNWEPSLMTSA